MALSTSVFDDVRNVVEELVPAAYQIVVCIVAALAGPPAKYPTTPTKSAHAAKNDQILRIEWPLT